MKDAEAHTDHTVGGFDPQRLIGLVVVVAVLLVTIVVGEAVRGRVIAGEALASAVGSEPQIGDCLTENPHKSGVDEASWAGVLPSLRTAPCTGPRFGEVVFVATDFTDALTTIDPADDPDHGCRTQADRYLEIRGRLVLDSGVPVGSTSAGMAVSPATNVLVALIGPNPRQRSAGQQWVACVIYLPRSIVPDVPITIDHSLRGGWLRDNDRGLFSLCVTGPTSHVAINCRWPHRFEMIRMDWGNASTPQALIDTACYESVVQALGTSTALTRGTLTSVVVPVRPNPNNDGGVVSGPAAVTAESPYLNICLVTATDGNKRLVGPLRGLGDAPVPIT